MRLLVLLAFAGVESFFTKHAKRFLLGSDTWVIQRWESYPSIMGGYRQWLSELPVEVAERIAWCNGSELFALE